MSDEKKYTNKELSAIIKHHAYGIEVARRHLSKRLDNYKLRGNKNLASETSGCIGILTSLIEKLNKGAEAVEGLDNADISEVNGIVTVKI